MSTPDLTENNIEIISTLPPVISNNIREKIEPEQISIENLDINKQIQKISKSERNITSQSINKIKPLYSLELVWCPNVLYFDIKDNIKIQTLRVWNASLRSIYLQSCGFCNERGRLGASWCCYPRTRLLLAPGLSAEFSIRTTAKDYSPVPSACIALQLAAAHLRDHVVGHFAIPIQVKFLNYIAPCDDEHG